MKRDDKNIFKMFFPLILASVFLPFAPAEGAMNSYCLTPPFVSQNISPNVLIMLDSSGSMNCLAYQSSYVPAQFVSGNYYGYFDPTKNYRYDTSGTPNRWIPYALAITNGTAANPVASGNFLNWITMSRQDVAKKILIGGRASSGTYAAADRTTNPVKLYGNANPQSSWTCATDDKSHDSTATNLIYPFVGDYKYTVATDGSYQFRIAFNDAPTFKLYPNSNFSSTNPAYTFPAAWVKTGTGSAYQVVDETTANTTDYIVNKSSTEAALFGYNHADATLVGSSGTIASVAVYAYAKKTGSSTVNLQGVLRLKGSTTEVEFASGLSALSTSYAVVSLGSFTMNPQTLAAWQWSDLIGTAADGSLLGFGVKASLSGAGNPSTSYYPTVSQVYIQINVSSPTAGGPYNIIVDQGATAASGVLDKMTADVRFGLANYNSSGEGGKIVDYADFGSVSVILKSISELTGSGGTPLGETLYELVRYFRQDSTYYSSSDYTKGCVGAGNGTYNCAGASAANKVPTSKDPFFYDFTDASIADKYVPCAKSYILLMTDGESYGDQTIPGSSTSAPYSACTVTNIKACSGYGGSPNNPNPRFAGTAVGQTYPNSGSDYLIDVAYWARTNDMRPGAETDIPTTWRQSLPGTQNIYLYPVYLFGSGSTLLMDASIFGGQ
ncbi:MAG: hypothetical protein HGA43_01790 [Nitrospirae bacterium]|nr:hypothetical protein [Nitrospirota bacterium]